jgi:hypothetical protein
VITSDTAAPAEAEAVLRQIRTTMTSQQVEAIAAMDLTQDDLGAFMEEARQSASQGSGDTFEGFRPGQGPDGGPGPGFAPPSGGGFGGEFGGGGGFSPEQRATGEAAGQTRGADSGRADLFLLRPLIAALTTLAGS